MAKETEKKMMGNKELKVSFDPKNKIIKTNVDDIFIIYSEWKRWVLTDLNSMYFAAFEFVDDVPNLINDWKLILEN